MLKKFFQQGRSRKTAARRRLTSTELRRASAYPLGTLRILSRRERSWKSFFSILLEDSAVTVPHLSRHIAKLRQMQDSLGHFLS